MRSHIVRKQACEQLIYDGTSRGRLDLWQPDDDQISIKFYGYIEQLSDLCDEPWITQFNQQLDQIKVRPELQHRRIKLLLVIRIEVDYHVPLCLQLIPAYQLWTSGFQHVAQE